MRGNLLTSVKMSAAARVVFDLNEKKSIAAGRFGVEKEPECSDEPEKGIAVCACGNTAQYGECVREACGDRYSRAVMSEAVELLSSCHYLKHPHITIIMAFN